jgi:hypothetical protein
MALSIGTVSNSGNKASTTGFTQAHTSATNTKYVVALLTGYDTSDSDYAHTVTFDSIRPIYSNIAAYSSRRVAAYVFSNVSVGTSKTFSVTFGGTVTDAQVTIVDIVSTSYVGIMLDNVSYNIATNTVHSIAKTGMSFMNAMYIGCITTSVSAITAMSVTTGTEISGSETDMGSYCSGCAYATTTTGAATITWTMTSSVVNIALGAVFYEYSVTSTALGNPTDGSSTTDTTPTVYFTGTDYYSQAVDYHVHIGSATEYVMSGTFDTQVNLGLNSGDLLSQSFTAPATGVLKDITVKLRTVGSPTGTIGVRIRNIATGFEYPGAIPLAATQFDGTLGYGSIAISSLTSTFAYYTIPLLANLVSGTKYCIIFDGINATLSVSNYVYISKSTSDAYTGSIYNDDATGTTWSSSTGDIELTYTMISSVVNAYSTDHTGFSAGASHPTTSGVEQNYTVQSALSTGTYYWTVQAQDPNKTTLYDYYATAKRFIISSGPQTHYADSTINLDLAESGVAFKQKFMTVTAALSLGVAAVLGKKFIATAAVSLSIGTSAVLAKLKNLSATVAVAISQTAPMIKSKIAIATVAATIGTSAVAFRKKLALTVNALTIGQTAVIVKTKALAATVAATIGVTAPIIKTKLATALTALTVGATSSATKSKIAAAAVGIVLGIAAELSELNALTAAVALTFGSTAVLSGKTYVTAAVAMTVTPAGVAYKKIALAAASSLTTTTTGALTRIKGLAAAVSVAFGTAGLIAKNKITTAAVNLTTTTAGVMVKSKVAIAAVSISVGVSSAALIKKFLSKLEALTIGASAALDRTKQLATSVALDISEAGVLTLKKFAASSPVNIILGAVAEVFNAGEHLIMTLDSTYNVEIKGTLYEGTENNLDSNGNLTVVELVEGTGFNTDNALTLVVTTIKEGVDM